MTSVDTLREAYLRVEERYNLGMPHTAAKIRPYRRLQTLKAIHITHWKYKYLFELVPIWITFDSQG